MEEGLRSVMRLGPVHVVVVIGSTPMRESVTSWLRAVKRVRIVRSVGSVAQLDGHRIECDLVIASGLEGSRELRAVSKRFRDQAGLVALTLGTTPLPAGWVPVLPGAGTAHVLDHAMPHPERSLANVSTIFWSTVVALVALIAAFVHVPFFGVSFQRAALAYAERFPDADTWWHVWGSGAPYLAASSWPLLKGVALLGLGPQGFVLVASAIGALYGVAFHLLARRAGAGRIALAAALAAMIPPALWVWPRGGDAASLAGLAGVVLALAGTRVGRLRLLTTALAVAVSSFGGYLWVLTAAAVAIGFGVRTDRARVSLAGGVLGILMSTAITLPPVLSRGLDGFRPALPRAFALSDLAPVAASAALLALILAGGRYRRATLAIATLVLVAANVLALAVPVQTTDPSRVPTTGPFGRLAVHPAQALSVVTTAPDVPTTGDEVPAALMLGEGTREATNAKLEHLGADRAMLPDRSAAVIFNTRDWTAIDRERLILGAPNVRPILTAGITMSLLVVADEADARTFGLAVEQLGATTERVIGIQWARSLEELDVPFLREFTMVVVYGRPWQDPTAAGAILEPYLEQGGFVYMDAAARPGEQPLVPEARTIQAREEEFRAEGDLKQLVTADRGFSGRLVTIDDYRFRNDPAWERAALFVGAQRAIQFGETRVASEAVAAHLVWSGVDLPGRAAAGEERATIQLQTVLSWMLGAANVQITGGYGRAAGAPVLKNETAESEFVSPTHWRIKMSVATTGVLFKERAHPQWRAYQVETSSIVGAETRTALPILPTVDGHMYVTLPPNARQIDFVFERHPLEIAARGLSAVATFLTLALSFFLWRRR